MNSVRITRNRSRGESFSAFEPYSQRKKPNSDETPNMFKILSDASEKIKGSTPNLLKVLSDAS